MKPAHLALTLLTLILTPALAMATPLVSYTTLQTQPHNLGQLTLRAYPARVVANISATGPQRQAISQGFRPLADYIFARAQTTSAPQASPQPIGMTAPVLQTASPQPKPQQIAMTAPVLQTPQDATTWAIQFVMPDEFTLATLPAPSNPSVTLQTLPARTIAAIQFSGFATSSALAQRTQALQSWVQANGWQPAGPITYAFYNPPWTLPFWRRNEVWLPVTLPASPTTLP